MDKKALAGRFLSFSLGDNQYAVPLLSVKEVIAVPEIKRIPQAPDYFLGVINLRGQIISVIDLRRKLDVKADLDAEACVIICNLGSQHVGLVVSSVKQVINLAQSDIGPRPEGQGSRQAYITGLAKVEDIGMVILLDIAACLDLNDRNHIAA